MSSRNCRTEGEQDEETTRVLDALEESERSGPERAERALSKACDSTLVRVMECVPASASSDRWQARIRAILEERRVERAAR